jgi:hypothetical protein
MPSEYYTHIHDSYLSDSCNQLNETGFSILSAASSYSQLNVTESLVDTSSEAFSSETHSYDSNGWATYLNQNFTPNTVSPNEHAGRTQHGTLEYQFLMDMAARFPSLFSFIGHVFFPLFSKMWIDFQNNLLLANDPTCRLQILFWCNCVTSEIQRVLEAILHPSSNNENLDSQSKNMFSAFRLLKDLIKEAHQEIQAIQIAEEGLILRSQDTSSTIWPITEGTENLKSG